MDLRSALRLKPGDKVLFGPHRRLKDCWWQMWGEVVHVTENGGIKVVDEFGLESWIPYSNVIRWRHLSQKERLEKLYSTPWDGPF
jgi:hypothetical protein